MSDSSPITEASDFARNIRRLTLGMVHRANASHIGSVLSMADLLAELYRPGGAYGWIPSIRRNQIVIVSS
jgi:transketolase N-terminal domain/subunit